MDECGSQGVRRAVEDRLRTNSLAATSDHADVFVDVHARRSESGWEAEVVTRARSGQILGRRALEGDDRECTPMIAPVAFVVALVVDAPTLRAEVEEVKPPREVVVGVAGRVVAGATPLWSGGAGAQVTIDPGRGPVVRVDAFAYLPRREGASLRAWSAQLGVSLCPRITHRSLRLDLCAEARGGFVRAAGVGFDDSLSDLQPTLDLGVWVRPSVRVRRAVLGFGLGASVAALRPEFVFVDGAGTTQRLYRPRIFGVQLEVSVGFAFDSSLSS